MKQWSTPWGKLRLSRFPFDQESDLNAWDRADELLIAEVAQQNLPSKSFIIVYNDLFGAITCALILAGFKVAQISDSALTQRSTLWNLEINSLDDHELFLLDSLSVPSGDRVLLRLPASAQLLQFQISQIARYLPLDGRLMISGRSEDLDTRVPFEPVFGPFEQQKSDSEHLFFGIKRSKLAHTTTGFPLRWQIPQLGVQIVHHAGVFSPGVINPATSLLLQHFPKKDRLHGLVVDLGCGNGLLGLAAARRSTDAQIYCVDESFLAVWSARETFRANELGGRGKFLCGDGLEDFDKNSVDLILCTPPSSFHEWPTSAPATKMFKDALSALVPGGELWVATDRRLGLHKPLASLFSELSTAAADASSIVLCAKKSR